jgi:hypothetical protein
MKNLIWLSAAALGCTAIFISGCGTAFTGSRTEDTKGSPTNQAALHYFLPEDVVEVVATIERTTVTKLGGTLASPVKETNETAAVAEALVNLQTVPDTSRSYLLDAAASALSRNNTAITITPTGLLRSVNAQTTGTGGVVFENAMKVAGSLLPLVNLASGALDTGTKTIELDPIAALRNSGNLFSNRIYQTVPFASIPLVAPAGCGQVSVQRELPQTREYNYAFPNLPDKVRLVKDYCDSLVTLEARRQSYVAVLQAFDAATDAAQITTLDKKLSVLRSEYLFAVDTHAKAREAITAAVTKYIEGEGIGKKTSRYTQRVTLHISKMPDAEVVAALNGQVAADEAAFVALVDRITGLNPNVVRLFKSTGVFVTSSPTGDPANDLEVAAIKDGVAAACLLGKNDSLPCVFYRSPRSYLLTAWTMQKILINAMPQVRLLPGDSKIVDAIADNAPTLAVELRDSTFTKRDSTLAFNERGRLTGLTRDYGSAAADASASIATGLSGGISQYQTTLTSLKTIRETENAIKLQPLQQQLAVANARGSLELQPLQQDLAMANAQAALDMQAVQSQVQLAQQQLALLNGQTSLQSATQGQSAVLQTQLVNIQNSLATAQGQLVASQAALANAQASSSQSEAQAELAASASMLSARIKQLQNEISLLELEKKLEEIQKPKQ